MPCARSSFRAGEDNSCLRPRDHCDRRCELHFAVCPIVCPSLLYVHFVEIVWMQCSEVYLSGYESVLDLSLMTDGN
jgi:hypothetical protein